ncbi:polysaccharide lyase family 1 protein [Nocardiopsis sp. MG754419]|uniref:pectate lyase family protein n=1 Tax=Nocardiopsis sp. MG754419 TaxID=2259865 RepID=UPI001BADFD25|nr:pectate lyase [Nocardiopsis sp. MG754419]MBR8742854.1 pectate lyase [Nocardiopsis sp. MG754419]
MRRPPPIPVLTLAALLTATTLLPVAPASAEPDVDPRGVARETLPEGDGWGSAGRGTTGGSQAAPENVHVVSTLEELRAALGGKEEDTPRIVYVDGRIDANTDPDGAALSCDDYAVDGYTLDAYLETYDPEVWGRQDPEGPLEEARLASAAVQAEQIRVEVGSNTTLVGLGGDAALSGVNLRVHDVDNVILRNLTFSDAHDCFPGWDPTDGASGNWNSEYDQVEVSGATNVWVDHNTFDDGDNPGTELPEYFGRKYEVHDGLLDIVRETDLVTVSRNHFDGRDKAMLLGNSDSRTTDRGYLRVTWRHNHFDGLGERAPRVRFGQVHVHNNVYTVRDPEHFGYSVGVGRESHLYVENNLFDVHDGIEVGTLLRNWGGTDIVEHGNVLTHEGSGRPAPVDLVAEHNAHFPDAPLGTEVTWVPQFTAEVEPVHAIRGLPREVGAGRL